METAVVVVDLDVDGLGNVLDGQGEGLVPPGVEVLVDGAASVHLLAANLELDVRVAGAWQHRGNIVCQYQ